MITKKSIRFYNDHEVRAVWDEENSKWWFSANDIVRAINEEEDYNKARNYWKYLKGKMAKEGIQLVSVTNHFKFQVPDGKQRTADVLDAEAVQTLAQHYPINRANAFLSWFVYSDNTIDGQSKKKAYTLAESGILDSMNPGSGQYVIGTPYLPYMRVRIGSGRWVEIKAPRESDRNRYIQRVRWNGKPHDKAYLTYSQLMEGGTLEFEMGPRPNKHLFQSPAAKSYSLTK